MALKRNKERRENNKQENFEKKFKQANLIDIPIKIEFFIKNMTTCVNLKNTKVILKKQRRK